MAAYTGSSYNAIGSWYILYKLAALGLNETLQLSALNN